MYSFGHQTKVATDGIEGLAKLPLDIDLVLLDAEMPHMDGFEVAAQIREDEGYRDLPIIMLTGLTRREDHLRAIKVGINDFVNKPFDAEELRLRSASLLRLKQATDALKQKEAELGEYFDPDVLDIFLAHREAIEEIQETHQHLRNETGKTT